VGRPGQIRRATIEAVKRLLRNEKASSCCMVMERSSTQTAVRPGGGRAAHHWRPRPAMMPPTCDADHRTVSFAHRDILRSGPLLGLLAGLVPPSNRCIGSLGITRMTCSLTTSHFAPRLSTKRCSLFCNDHRERGGRASDEHSAPTKQSRSGPIPAVGAPGAGNAFLVVRKQRRVRLPRPDAHDPARQSRASALAERT
jgi:hypothetical protein